MALLRLCVTESVVLLTNEIDSLIIVLRRWLKKKGNLNQTIHNIELHMKYRYLINIYIAFDEIKSDQSIPTNKPKISNYLHVNRCCINIVESNHVIQILLCNK